MIINCLRCGAPMAENCKVDIFGSTWHLGSVYKKTGLLKAVSAPCRCAVCPQCGHIEFYTDSPSAFANLVKTMDKKG